MQKTHNIVHKWNYVKAEYLITDNQIESKEKSINCDYPSLPNGISKQPHFTAMQMLACVHINNQLLPIIRLDLSYCDSVTEVHGIGNTESDQYT